MDRIKQKIDEGLFEEAKVELEKLLETDGKNLEVLELLGACYINLDMFNQSKIIFETVVKYKPEDTVSWFCLGSCYDKLEDYFHAQGAYLKSIELNQENIEAYKNLCIVYLKQNEHQKSVDLALNAIECSKSDYLLYYLAGTALMGMGKVKDSIEYFEKALELEPSHAQLNNNLGTSYLTLQEYDKAKAYYLKAAELDPTNAMTFYNIGSIYQLQNNHREACPYFQKAYDIEQSEHYMVSLALSEFKSEQYEEALKHYKFLASHNPEKHNFQYNVATCYEALHEYNFAILILEPLVGMNPKSLTMWQKLASIYNKIGKHTQAKALYEEIVAQHTVNYEIYYDYAITAFKAKDSETAEIILKKVVELESDFAPAHKDLAVLYLGKRLFDYAKDEIEKAYNLAPENFDIIFEYANFNHAISEYEEAAKFYDKALKLHQDAKILLFATMNAISLNDLDKALHHINKALMIAPSDYNVVLTAGKVNYLKGDYESAKFLLVKSIELNNTPDALNLLALAYFGLGEYEQACNIFESLLDASPHNLNLMLNCAKCYEKTKDIPSAKSKLFQILDIFPDYEEAQTIMERLK